MSIDCVHPKCRNYYECQYTDADRECEEAVAEEIFKYIRTSSENFELRTHIHVGGNSFLIHYHGNDYRITVTKETG